MRALPYLQVDQQMEGECRLQALPAKLLLGASQGKSGFGEHICI